MRLLMKNAGIFFYVFSNDIKNIVGDFELEVKAQNVSKKTADVYIIAKDNNSILNNRLLKTDLLSKKVLASIVKNINIKDVSISCVMENPETLGSSPKCITWHLPNLFISIKSQSCFTYSLIFLSSLIVDGLQSYKSTEVDIPQRFSV